MFSPSQVNLVCLVKRGWLIHDNDGANWSVNGQFIGTSGDRWPDWQEQALKGNSVEELRVEREGAEPEPEISLPSTPSTARRAHGTPLAMHPVPCDSTGAGAHLLYPRLLPWRDRSRSKRCAAK